MRLFAALSVILCLLGWFLIACQASLPPPTSTPLPTIVPTPARTRTPTPGPLTDAEAIALVKEEIVTRGIALHTVRITIAGKPRSASIRYASSYVFGSKIFRIQTTIVGLNAARTLIRVQPPLKGGIRLSIIPAGEDMVGLRVIVIDWPLLEAWANGHISDQEFVNQWTVGDVTRE